MNEEFIKEIIKSTISGEPHLGTNLKEQCLMYFDNLISENKQLKQQQKEFISYLEKEIVDCRAGSSQYYSAIEHLKLYNKVIGGDK